MSRNVFVAGSVITVSLSAYLVVFYSIMRHPAELLAIPFFLLLIAPGIPWFARVPGRQSCSTVNSLALPLGFSVSLCLILLSILLFGQLLPAVIWPLLIAVTGISILLSRRCPATDKAHTWNSSDPILLCLLLLLALLITTPAFDRLGEEYLDGEVFRAYFNVDYLKHLAVTAELEHGMIPPLNPYVHGSTLHYYWFFYLAPALIHRTLPAQCEILPVMIQLSLLVNSLVLISLYAAFRALAIKRFATTLAIAASFCTYSFEGTFAAIRLALLDQGVRAGLWGHNIDAVSRWYFGHPQIDGLFRAMLYTPQHFLALSLLLLPLLCRQQDRSAKTSIRRTLTMTVVAVFSLGISTFLGLIFIAWILTEQTVRLFYQRNWNSLLSLLVSLIITTIGITIFFTLGILHQQEGTLELLSIDSILRAPIILIMNFGLLFFTGLAGVISALRHRHEHAVSLLILLLLSLAFVFGIQISHFPSDVGLKTGLVIALALTLFTAILLDRLTSRVLLIRWIPILLLLVFLSLPTVIIDASNSANLWHPDFVTLVSQVDLSACRWIRTHLPEAAVIQAEPVDRGVAYSLIPTFAHRRTYLGDRMHARIFLGDEREFCRRLDLVKHLYHAVSREDIVAICRQSGIDYIYLGPREKELAGSSLGAIRQLPTVYDRDGVQIYRAGKPGPVESATRWIRKIGADRFYCPHHTTGILERIEGDLMISADGNQDAAGILGSVSLGILPPGVYTLLLTCQLEAPENGDQVEKQIAELELAAGDAERIATKCLMAKDVRFTRSRPEVSRLQFTVTQHKAITITLHYTGQGWIRVYGLEVEGTTHPPQANGTSLQSGSRA